MIIQYEINVITNSIEIISPLKVGVEGELQRILFWVINKKW